jgi:DNA-binding NarL/FixJ family response regulator
MAISRGRELLSQDNPDPDEIRKSIGALVIDASHVQKTMNAGVRDYVSGEATINEILDLIQQLKKKI